MERPKTVNVYPREAARIKEMIDGHEYDSMAQMFRRLVDMAYKKFKRGDK